MARAIVLNHAGADSRFDFKKLERKALYGGRRRVALDAGGAPCQRASLTRDGRFLLRSGMTSQGYVTAGGRWVPNGDLVGLTPAGEPVEAQPSTLGVSQALEEVPARQLFDLRVTTTYMLSPQHVEAPLAEALAAGKVFRFAFNYRQDFRAETAFLVQNEAGYFAVIGVPAPPAWVEPAAAPPPLVDDAEDDGDELDFEMF